MQLIKKLNLSRFKKSMQGITDFATLIEQADPSHRVKILEQAQAQDSDFVHKVMRKVVFFEELVYLDDTVVAEILSKTSSKVLAYALKGMPEEFRQTILKQIGFRELRTLKDEEEKMGSEVTANLILGAQKQILKIGRTLELQQKFVFELTTCPRFKKKAVPAAASAATREKTEAAAKK